MLFLITLYCYGWFIGEMSNYSIFNDSYGKHYTDNNYICEFVRFELFSDYYQHYNGEIESRTQDVVRNLERLMNEIWMDFRQKVMKNVKRENIYGLEIIIDESGAYMEDFLRIYYGMMECSDAEVQFYFEKPFFEKLLMRENAVMFHVRFEGGIIPMEFVIYGAENCYSYFEGTDYEYFYTRANDFFKFKIIMWAKENGLKNFVLGGSQEFDDRIFQCKINLALHGIEDFYIGRKTFDENLYWELLSIRSKGNKDMEDKLIHIGFFRRISGDIEKIVYFLYLLRLWDPICPLQRKEA